MSVFNQWCNQPIQPHHFCSNTITYSVTNHVSLLCLNVCTWNEADSTNGRKQVAWYDVTKCFVFHKAAILTNFLESFKHLNVKYAIKIKYCIMPALL